MAMNSMTDDDSVSGSPRRSLLLALACFAVFAVLFAAVLFTVLFGKASDGGPIARLDIAAPAAVLSPAKRTPVKAAATPPVMSADHVGTAPHSGADAVSEGQASTGSGMPGSAHPGAASAPELPAAQTAPDKITKPVYAGKALVADPALIESTPTGPLPRIADDGRTPMAAYAPAIADRKRPKIALVIGGLGVSARATQAALDGLPPGVTLAFEANTGDVQRWVSEARKRGHEVLLEVPMEPYDFPDSDPGPRTLLSTLTEDGNIQRLVWSMSRFTGYAGVTNLLGGRFLASPEALAPVMTFLARRGVLFFDSGSNSRSVSEAIAQRVAAPYVQSVVKVDSIQSATEIDQQLSELESRARAAGAAAGNGFLYPITVNRVATWAKGLEGRGFVLVPASAIVAQAK